MSPKFIPPYNQHQDYYGEALVFKYLQDTLPDEATVFTHVRIPNAENENSNSKYHREADAIVVMPNGYLVIVEVKGGQLKPVSVTIDGETEEWMASIIQVEEGDRPYRIEHPARQADTLRLQLNNYLSLKGTKEEKLAISQFTLRSIAALPHTDEENRPRDKKYSNYVFCKEKCRTLGEQILKSTRKDKCVDEYAYNYLVARLSLISAAS